MYKVCIIQNSQEKIDIIKCLIQQEIPWLYNEVTYQTDPHEVWQDENLEKLELPMYLITEHEFPLLINRKGENIVNSGGDLIKSVMKFHWPDETQAFLYDEHADSVPLEYKQVFDGVITYDPHHTMLIKHLQEVFPE